MYPNIALSGKARSGKDTVAAHLVEHHGYVRLAFADPLKEMALAVDPILADFGDGVDEVIYRLSDAVESYGWEQAKDAWPEVRRILQQMGQTVRSYDEDFWIRVLLAKAAKVGGAPIVVTDVRYPNEYGSLARAGFVNVRISRPLDSHPFRTAAEHESETALDDFTFTEGIVNNGTIAQLKIRTNLLLAHLRA